MLLSTRVKNLNILLAASSVENLKIRASVLFMVRFVMVVVERTILKPNVLRSLVKEKEHLETLVNVATVVPNLRIVMKLNVKIVAMLIAWEI